MLKEYPDMHRTLEDIIAEGYKMWFLEHVTGTKALLSWGSQGLLQTETLRAFTGEEMVKLIQGL